MWRGWVVSRGAGGMGRPGFVPAVMGTDCCARRCARGRVDAGSCAAAGVGAGAVGVSVLLRVLVELSGAGAGGRAVWLWWLVFVEFVEELLQAALGGLVSLDFAVPAALGGVGDEFGLGGQAGA